MSCAPDQENHEIFRGSGSRGPSHLISLYKELAVISAQPSRAVSRIARSDAPVHTWRSTPPRVTPRSALPPPSFAVYQISVRSGDHASPSAVAHSFVRRLCSPLNETSDTHPRLSPYTG